MPQKSKAAEHAPAGPHAKPELTDKSKTPGTGMLPDPENGEANQAPSHDRRSFECKHDEVRVVKYIQSSG